MPVYEPSCGLHNLGFDDVCTNMVWSFIAELASYTRKYVASLSSLLNDQFLIGYSTRMQKWKALSIYPIWRMSVFTKTDKGGWGPQLKELHCNNWTVGPQLKEWYCNNWTVERYSINMWYMHPKWNWKLPGCLDTCRNIWLYVRAPCNLPNNLPSTDSFK